jgi:hypothetical protein
MTTNMANTNTRNLPMYEGNENPKKHRFIYEKTWDAVNVIDELKKMA